MPHHFLVKDIAFQAGLSTATVDRVLNKRKGVRAQTAKRVSNAISELERQETNLSQSGKTLALDVIMEAPDRFVAEVRAALEQNASICYPILFRTRFSHAEVMDTSTIAKQLDRIRLRGSDGVILKAPDSPDMVAAINRLEQAGIPVITLVTDIPNAKRIAYSGINNDQAGQTAAFLLATALGNRGGTVLVTSSSNRFHGEESRVAGFKNAIAERYKNLSVVEISEGYGRDDYTGRLMSDALGEHADICAVYSVGGGNRAIIDAFDKAGRSCRAFVAHDLDADNRELLRSGRISFVLQHDLEVDARSMYRKLLEHHRHLRHSDTQTLSQLVILSPFNFEYRPISY